MKSKTISILIPSYNEEKNILPLYEEIDKEVRKNSDKYDFEYVFVDDGSKDDTIKILEEISKKILK